MKFTQQLSAKRNIVLRVLIVTVLFSLTSCVRKINFLTSSVTPAARGYVKVKSDNNKNFAISVHLTDLSEVQRLQPAKQTYVIWMETSEEATKNIGQIKSSSGFISKQLKASFETVSSLKPTRIFITAEDDAGTQYPGTQVVLSTDKFYR